MAYALQTGFQYATGEIIIVTDADAIWANKHILQEAIKWLSCDNVGAVSCTKVPINHDIVEISYRQYYNLSLIHI